MRQGFAILSAHRYLVGFSILLALAASASWAEDDWACITCHPAAGFTERLAKGVPASPRTEMLRYRGTAHDSVRCTACHPDANPGPHPKKPTAVSCLKCHGHDGTEAGMAKVGIDLLHKQTGPNAPNCNFCHGYHGVVDPTNVKEVPFRAHIPDLCATCHNNPQQASQIPQATEYWNGVHSQPEQGKGGVQRNATCIDCHYMHASNRHRDVLLFPARTREPLICGRCHQQEGQQYQMGVHGTALGRDPQSLPVCIDCHRSHDILPAKDPKSWVSRGQVVQTCERCHGDQRVAERFKLTTIPARSYEASYHGMARRLGHATAPTCVDCHNSHEIRHPDDPAASTSAAKVTATCGKCHPGVLSGKVSGKYHVLPTPAASIPMWLITRIYQLLVGGSVVGFVLFIVFDIRAHRRLEKAGIEERLHHMIQHLPRPPATALIRLSRFERVHHWLLLTSFIILAITGLALVFPDSYFARAVVYLCGGMSGRAIVHRVAAGVLIAIFIAHALWALVTREGYNTIRRLLPGVNDVRDLGQTLALFAGRSQHRPSFGKYAFGEKFEFWALVWGTLVMSVTGLILAFLNQTLGTLPKWVLDISEVIHKWEAILAVAAIAIWHMYHVVWKPGVYPGNRAWLTGRIEFDEYVREHPRDYAEAMGWLGEKPTAEEAASSPGQDAPPDKGE